LKENTNINIKKDFYAKIYRCCSSILQLINMKIKLIGKNSLKVKYKYSISEKTFILITNTGYKIFRQVFTETGISNITVVLIWALFTNMRVMVFFMLVVMVSYKIC
jgi:hypothetical protein